MATSHLAHSPAGEKVGRIRSHAVALTVAAALVLAAAIAALIIAFSSASSTPSDATLSPASVHGNYVYGPAYRISNGKYLNP